MYYIIGFTIMSYILQLPQFLPSEGSPLSVHGHTVVQERSREEGEITISHLCLQPTAAQRRSKQEADYANVGDFSVVRSYASTLIAISCFG